MSWPTAIYGAAMAASSALTAAVLVAGDRMGLHPAGLVLVAVLAILFALTALSVTGKRGDR